MCLGTNLDGSQCARLTGSKPYCIDHEKVRLGTASLLAGRHISRSRSLAALSVPRRAGLVSEADFAAVADQSSDEVEARWTRCASAMSERVTLRAADDDELVITADSDKIMWFGSLVPVPYEDDIVSVVHDGPELRLLIRTSEIPEDSRDRIRSSVHAMAAAATAGLNQKKACSMLRDGDVEVYGSHAQALASVQGAYDGISYRDEPSEKWWNSAVVLIDRSGAQEVRSVARRSYEFTNSGELRTTWVCNDNEKWDQALTLLNRMSAFGWQADSSAVCVPIGWHVADFGDAAADKSVQGTLSDYL